MSPVICLASASPRRAELLRQIGVPFSVFACDIDETPLQGESPEVYATRMSAEKARCAWRETGGTLPVLAADTIVVCDDRILVKPCHEADNKAMLQLLSGRSHQVLSAVTLITTSASDTALSRTIVTFREIDHDEITRYWQTGEPCDKAGGYAIQGLGAVFIDRIEGSYSGVVGLPLECVVTLFGRHGICWWCEAGEHE